MAAIRTEQPPLCRYDGLDILKAFCAFLIVCIHFPFPGETGRYITALARIAVPIFFMITGFFYDGIAKRNAVGKQIKKIAVFLAESNILFLFWRMILVVRSDESIIVFLHNAISAKSIFKFILLNASPIFGHLWYLGAIFYVLIIFAFADKLNVRKLLYMLTPALLIGGLALGNYSLVLFGRLFSYIISRNFLFVGIPYFSIGCLLKQYEGGLKEHLRSGLLIGLAVLFTATTLLERYALVSVNMNPTRDLYISTTFLAITVFIIALKGIGLFGSNGKTAKVLNFIGRKYSAWVYILHPIFIAILANITGKIGILNIYGCIAPIAVYFVTNVFVLCIFKICKTAKGMVKK